MTSAPVYVGTAGMACPVGSTWPSACAAMRAGIARKSVFSYSDSRGREITASYHHDLLPDHVPWQERWLSLLARALRDATRSGRLASLEQLPLYLALPARDGRPYPAAFVCDALSSRLGLRIPQDHVQVFAEGAYGGYAALGRGRACVRPGRPCVVAAADSLLSARRLLELNERRRLLVEGNSDGVIPGEAAAAIVLTTDKRNALASVLGLGFGEEPARSDNDVPLRADGLVGATRAALKEAALQLHEVHFRVSDAAGESFAFKEQALLVARLLGDRKLEFPLWLPAESLGDTGAAAGLCGALWAMAAWARGYAPGPHAVVCAGNDQGARAAVVLASAR